MEGSRVGRHGLVTADGPQEKKHAMGKIISILAHDITRTIVQSDPKLVAGLKLGFLQKDVEIGTALLSLANALRRLYRLVLEWLACLPKRE